MNSILWITVVLSFIAVHVQSQQANNNFSYGNLTETSVLLHSWVLNDYTLYCFCEFLIVDIFCSEHLFVNGTPNGYVYRALSYYNRRWEVVRKTEAFDLSVNSTGARVIEWGINERTSWLYFESFLGGDIDFLVNVYGEIAEPIIYERGQLSEQLSILAHT